jgi:hypothetical protein
MMFGSSNKQPNDQIPEHSIQGALQSVDTQAAAPPPVAQTPTAPPVPPAPQPALTVVQPSDNPWGHPGVPLDAPQADAPAAVDSSVPAQAPDTSVAPSADQPAPGSEELIDIKQKALTQLSPLVGHLEQTPEEKFRTTMMMIQASDDQSLVPVAYEAANAITDEKAKAQALLDIVNEINYFTQHHQN